MLKNEWIQILSILTNVSILVVGIKLIRYLARIEMKVDLMWNVFKSDRGLE